jgi:predicted ester cyclase
MRKILLYLTILVVLLSIASCQKPDYSKQIGPIVDQYVGVWNGDSLTVLDKISDKNFELRIIPSFEAITGIEKLKERITGTRTSFPDFQVKETERLLVSDTAIVLRWDVKGTFKGENEMPPTGNKVNVPGFSVVFFNKGKLTGEWIAYSDLTWYKQLGFNLVPPEIEKKK